MHLIRHFKTRMRAVNEGGTNQEIQVKQSLYQRMKKAGKNHIKSLFFGLPLLIVKEAFIQFAVCGFIFLYIPQELAKYYSKLHSQEYFSCVILSFFFVFVTCIVYPVVVVFVMFSSRTKLEEPKTF